MKNILIMVVLLAAGTACKPATTGGNAQPSANTAEAEYARQLEASEEQLRRSETQLKIADDQARRSDELLEKQQRSLDRSEAQSRRLDELLDKWEEQAKRYNALLDRWERSPLPPPGAR